MTGGGVFQRAQRRVIVWATGDESVGWRLPPALPITGTWVSGGVRTLHELAVAARVTGREVELRGHVFPPALAELAAEAGFAPTLPTEPRRPRTGEIVIVPEGIQDPLALARVVLSGAHVVLVILAPPGLFGWPLVDDHELVSPLEVDPATLARLEHFRALAGLGIVVWTNIHRIQELAASAGLECRFIGNGNPLPPGPPAEKTVDVAWLRSNRWAPLAEEVARRTEATVDGIEEVEHPELLRRLGTARVLLWPSRIEGHARIALEARAAGTVPVALASNVFAAGLAEEHGAVAVETLEEMPAAIHALLADSERLAELAERGRHFAREQVDWPRFVQRVDEALDALDAAEDPSTEARGAMGARVEELQEAASSHAELLTSQLEAARTDRDQIAGDLAALRSRKAVRVALRVAELRPRRRTSLP
ncbi:MAG TPA: glycosyltransferase [Gaiellaceae bacterium]|nr:glycosyltransferase [Gaiellaceae bacterium]